MTYHAVSDLKNKGKYELSHHLTQEFLATLDSNPLAQAYVLGCIQAVNLRHLGRNDEAETAFSKAFEAAKPLNPVIVAYILNDWSSLRSGNEALDMVRRAIDILSIQAESPDPERYVPADLAYIQATRARASIKAGVPSCFKTLKAKRRFLGKVRRKYPRYKSAYFNVLAWECEVAKMLRHWLSLATSGTRLFVLAVWQDKLRLLRKYM